MSEEEDQVQRRHVRPVHVLEHQQYRIEGGAVTKDGQGFLEDPQLRPGDLPAIVPPLPQWPQGLDERMEGQVGAGKVDRMPQEDHKAGRLGAPYELRDQPGLADPGVAGNQHRRPATAPRIVHGALKLCKLPGASDEHIAVPCGHLGKYPAPGS